MFITTIGWMGWMLIRLVEYFPSVKLKPLSYNQSRNWRLWLCGIVELICGSSSSAVFDIG